MCIFPQYVQNSHKWNSLAKFMFYNVGDYTLSSLKKEVNKVNVVGMKSGVES